MSRHRRRHRRRREWHTNNKANIMPKEFMPKLPEQFELLDGEEFQPIVPQDVLPNNYLIGSKQPDIEEAWLKDNQEIYWYDLANNQVKIYSKSNRQWMPSQMTKLVCDYGENPPPIIGKIVRDSKLPPELKVSFTEALKLARQTLSERGK